MSKITKSQVQQVLRGIIRANPDALNPTHPLTGTCLYQQTKKGVTSRCVIGQTLFELDLPVPPASSDKSVYELDRKYVGEFTPSAIDFMKSVQHTADHLTHAGEPWSAIRLSKI